MHINLRRISKIQYRYVVYTQKEEKKAKSNYSNHSIYPIFFSGQSQLFIQLWATGSTYNTGNKNEG